MIEKIASLFGVEPGVFRDVVNELKEVSKVIGPMELLKVAVGDVSKNMDFLADAEKNVKTHTDALNKALGSLNSDAIDNLDKESEKLIKTITRSSDAFKDNAAKSHLAKKAIEEQLDKYKKLGITAPDSLKKLGQQYGVLSNKKAKFGAALTIAGKAMQAISKIGTEVVGVLQDFGVMSNRTAKQAKEFLGGIGEIGSGLAQIATNPVGGAIAIIGGALKAGVAAWKYFSEMGIRSAIDKEREFIDISEETEDKIIELAKKIDDTHAATSMFMDEIINNAKINIGNFDQYAIRTTEIVDDLERGAMTAAQAQESMGKAFTAILAKAKDLGTKGSKSMIAMIQRVRQSGLQVAEIQDYVNSKLGEGANALKDYLSTFDTKALSADIRKIGHQLAANDITVYKSIELSGQLRQKQEELSQATSEVVENWGFMQNATSAMFSAYQSEGKSFIETTRLMGEQLNQLEGIAADNGLAISGALKEVVDLSSFIKQNETLATRVEATNKIMTSLGDTAYLTGSMFNSFADQANIQFQTLIRNGATEEQALAMLAPQLNKLNEYASTYNLTLDAQTSKLIAKGRAAGVVANQETEIFNRMNDLLYAIAVKLQADIPKSAEQTKQALHEAKEAGGVIDLSVDTKYVETALNNVQKTMKERPLSMEYKIEWRAGFGGHIQAVKVPIEVDDGAARNFMKKYQPVFKKFMGELEKNHKMKLDFSDPQLAFHKMKSKMDAFKALLKENKLKLSDADAQEVLIRFSKMLGALHKQSEKEMQLRIRLDNARVDLINKGLEPFIQKLNKQYGIKIDNKLVLKALRDGKGSLLPFVNMLEKKYKVKIDTKFLKKLKGEAKKNIAPLLAGLGKVGSFFEKMGKMIGLDIDFSSVLEGVQEVIGSMLGFNEIQDKIDAEEERRAQARKDRADRWKQQVKEFAGSYNLTEADTQDPGKMLEKRAALVRRVFKDHEDALKTNKEGVEKLRKMMSDTLNLYVKFGKEVPDDIQAASCAVGAMTAEQEKAWAAANKLKTEIEDINKAKSMNALVQESSNLLEYLENLKGEWRENKQIVDAVAVSLEKNMRQYKSMKDIPDWMKQIGVELGVIDKKTGLFVTDIKNYMKGLGAMDLGATTKEVAMFGRSMDLLEGKLVNNPKLVNNMYKNLVKFEKQQKITHKTVADQKAWEKNAAAIKKTYKENEKLRKYLKMTDDDIIGLTETTREAALAKAEMREGLYALGDALGVSSKDVEILIDENATLSEKFLAAGRAAGAVIDKMASFGLMSEEMAAKMKGVAEGAAMMGSGIADIAASGGNPFKILAGGIKVISGLAKAIGSLFKKDKWKKRAKKALSGLAGVTDEMVKKLKETAKEMGSTTKAMNKLMAEFIGEAELYTATDLKGWSNKVVGMMDQLRGAYGRGAEELKSQIGDAFSELRSKADELGLHGSEAMLQMIRKARELKEQGKEIPEVFDYMKEKLMEGADAFETYVSSFADVMELQKEMNELQAELDKADPKSEDYTKIYDDLLEKQEEFTKATEDIAANWDFMEAAALSTFSAMRESGVTLTEALQKMGPQFAEMADMAVAAGIDMSDGMKELTDLSKFIQQNESLVSRIQAASDMMTALGNTTFLTEEQFNSFSQNALTQFDQLIDAGASEKQALMLLGPQLDNLIKYHNEYKWAIDDETQALIEKARTEGALNNKSLTDAEKQTMFQERMVEILEMIAMKFGVDIPGAMDIMGRRADGAFGNIGRHTAAWSNSLDDVEDQLRNGLPDAISDLDDHHGKHMTGNTIVTDTETWLAALTNVKAMLEQGLVDSIGNLDKKFINSISKSNGVIAELIVKLQQANEEGGDLQAVFDSYAKELGLSSLELVAMMEGASGQILQISEETQKKIDELAETLGNAHAAQSIYLADIIKDAELNETNLGAYVDRTADILDDFQNGSLTLKQTQEAMGGSFTALMEQTKALGMEGSREMLNLMRDVRAAGVEIAEIQAYVNDQLNSGIDALGKYLGTFSGGSDIHKKMNDLLGELDGADADRRKEIMDELATLDGDLEAWAEDARANFDSMSTYAVGMFGALIEEGATFMEAIQAMGPQLSQLAEIANLSGAEISGPLKDMLDMQTFIDQNETLATRISATTEMLNALGNSGYLTNEIFNQFQTDAQSQFDQLMTKTDDASLAYQMMGPQLAKLAWYASQYGYELDAGTEEMIRQAEQHGVNMSAMIPPEEKMVALMESLVTVLGGDIPYAMNNMESETKKSIDNIRRETGDWKDQLGQVQETIEKELPSAVTSLDKHYTDKMTGHSIVTETKKWKGSLKDVEDILGRQLLETADKLDKKYRHVSGNIYEYLQKTSKGGFMARMSFGQMVSQLERLKNSYDKLALKKRRSDKEEGMMDDYSRQIKELSEAIEESAPTLENFGKKFEEFQDQLSGTIGVNRGMIEIARGLREQGQSLKEIDDIIDDSLSVGAQGMADWLEALGTTREQIDLIKEREEAYLELKNQEEHTEEELKQLSKLKNLWIDSQKAAHDSMKMDKAAIKESQGLMVAYFHSMRAEGKSVTEVMDIMGDGFDALTAKREGGAVVGMTKEFASLYDLQTKMAGNETLIKGVEGLGQALRGMGDSMLYMSDETFANFESQATKSFKKLRIAGFDQEQSLKVIAPLLHDLQSYAKEYGFSLDDGTQKLINQAHEAGALRERQKSDTEKLIEVNEHLAIVMDRMADSLENIGKVSPFAALADEASALEQQTARMKHYRFKTRGLAGDIEAKEKEIHDLELAAHYAKTTAPDTVAGYLADAELKQGELMDLFAQQEKFTKLYEKTSLEVERLRKEYQRGLPGEGDYISAALGYHGILERDRWFRLHKDERVDVWSPDETRRLMATPVSSMNLSDSAPSNRGGDIVFEHITIQGEGGEETVKEFMTAIKGNKYGVTNLIKKVAQ